MDYEKIPAEKFAFVQENEKLHDRELQTKARSFFVDAMLRFGKNKSSVIAAWILALLILYAIVAPVLSPYEIRDQDSIYINFPPYARSVSDLHLGVLDGARTLDSQNDNSMLSWKAIGVETGLDPVLRILGTHDTEMLQKGQTVTRTTYDIEVNAYYLKGMIYKTFSYAEFQRIQDWQNETGVQVLYPYVEPKDISNISDNPNIWYQVDSRGNAVLDDNGDFIPAYSTSVDKAGAEYNSLRISGDPGNYIYSYGRSGSVQCRVLYYNYYRYLNGMEPTYFMGTNALGQDIFCGIGVGARFSIIFAILVSAINLTIGAFYGALQGYYGGWVDMLLDRIADILSGVPFVVVTTLFQLHLAQKVGIVPSFLFAFVLTGWIGMSALTRKQFYRFKSQEFVLAARTLGASDGRLMFKHIFPNAIGTIITSCALVIPGVISSETSMTYLGIVNLSAFAGTTIGTLLSQGNAVVTTAPHAILYPSIFLGLLMICFNLFGNGLRDAFNPTTRGGDD
ncbi:MAG: ABC transporter permease [Roseburia sp.]|nr:ABC transporter permease [Roseburia sp.]